MIPIRLISPSLARRQRLLNEVYQSEVCCSAVSAEHRAVSKPQSLENRCGMLPDSRAVDVDVFGLYYVGGEAVEPGDGD